MRIGEVAEAAGVTVRTIRYYHQAGVLPEPPRQANGYRAYTVDHLVAVLTIGQLTSSGLSLAQAAAVVADGGGVGRTADDGATSLDEALEEVDRALARKIDALSEQRRRLALARAGGHVGLSQVAAALTVRPADAPAATLLAHLYRDQPRLEDLASTFAEPAVRSALTAIQARFDAIDVSTPDEELDDLAAQTRSILATFPGDLPPLTAAQEDLFRELMERDMNERQKDFLRRQG